MTPATCFLCAERDAIVVHDGWPLCRICAEQANDAAWERLYGSHQSRTVAEPSRDAWRGR